MALRDDYPIALTHGDINRQNVLVHIHGPEAEDLEVTALLDWEQAGWRPIYWESWKVMFERSRVPEWVDVAMNEIGKACEEAILLESELQSITGSIPP